VLDGEVSDRWPGIVREEVGRWAEADPEEMRAEAEAWINGLTRRARDAVDLAEVLLGALLELTPPHMDHVITLTMEALAGQDQDKREEFRSSMARAMPRFPSPQFMRIQDAFAQVATQLGMAGWT